LQTFASLQKFLDHLFYFILHVRAVLHFESDLKHILYILKWYEMWKWSWKKQL